MFPFPISLCSLIKPKVSLPKSTRMELLFTCLLIACCGITGNLNVDGDRRGSLKPP